jgi:chemotaxis protein methyltransferase CheR
MLVQTGTRENADMEHQLLSPKQFKAFSDYIYDRCGIRMNANKVLLLSNRIRRRLKACAIASFDDYYRFLQSPSGIAEVENFLDVVTTNETFFFRTRKHFDWLRDKLINELVADYRDDKRPASLRIWSAACSTGAEAYSIAICLLENSYRMRDWSIQVLGTDISEETLGIAREGKYKSRTLESVSEKQRRRFFRHLPELDVWEVRPEVKQLVEFQHHNLVQLPPGVKFDCIFVCNVLIYFDQESKSRVIENVLSALAVGGYLVVGPSEGISDLLDGLQKISPLIYQKVSEIRPRAKTSAPGSRP